MDTHIQDGVGVEVEVDIQVQAIKSLNKELPMNDFGLPIGIYRVDLLPFHDYEPNAPTAQPSLPQGVGERTVPAITQTPSPSGVESPEPSNPALPSLSAEAQGDSLLPVHVEYRIAGFPARSLPMAFVPLQYDEGFPAFESGKSFWHQLDNEPTDMYRAFEVYLQMSMGRAGNIEDDDDPGISASGMRSIADLVEKLHPNLGEVELLAAIDAFRRAYYIYYWGLRTRAYDLFRVAQHRKQQELRAIETQDEHYVDARKLRHKVMQYMDNEEEFWDLMTPKVAIDLLKQVTALERISAGIPSAGPLAAPNERAGESLELTFRTVAQNNRASSEGATINEEGEVLDKALEDPETVQMLQRLIIKRG